MKSRVPWLALAILVLVSACGGTPTATLIAPTPQATPLIFPTAPAGWTVREAPSLRISLPPSWQPIALDEAQLKSEVDSASTNNPHLADTLRGILESGQSKSFLFYAADTSSTSVVTNVSVAKTTLPNGTSPEQAEKDYASALPGILKGAKLVAFETSMQINGRKAGEVDYDLPLVNAAGQVVTLRGVQYLFFLNSGDAFVVTITGDAASQETFVPLARQIGRSFVVTAP